MKQVSSLNTTMLVIDHLVNLTENILFKQLDLSANQPNERSILVTAMLDVFCWVDEYCLRDVLLGWDNVEEDGVQDEGKRKEEEEEEAKAVAKER